MPYFDRFDVAEAYACLVMDWAGSYGQVHGRPGISAALERIKFNPRPNLRFETLSENGQEIYHAFVTKHCLSLLRDTRPT